MGMNWISKLVCCRFRVMVVRYSFGVPATAFRHRVRKVSSRKRGEGMSIWGVNRPISGMWKRRTASGVASVTSRRAVRQRRVGGVVRGRADTGIRCAGKYAFAGPIRFRSISPVATSMSRNFAVVLRCMPRAAEISVMVIPVGDFRSNCRICSFSFHSADIISLYLPLYVPYAVHICWA